MKPLAPPGWAQPPIRAAVLLIATFSSLYLVTGDDGAPGGPLFALLLIYAAARGSEPVAARLGLPPLLGMLSAGLLARNVPFAREHVGERVDPAWSAAVRLLALALILCRAGLAFDIPALRRLFFVMARLAVLPCLVETAIIGVLAATLLGFPLPWAVMLGFVVAAISPAVVVPGLLSLQERGYGTTTGISTMVIAAAPLDDACAIAGFGICLSFAIDRSGGAPPLWLDLARAPLEVVLGVAVGAVGAGLLVLLLPVAAQQDTAGDGAANPKREECSNSDRLALLSALAVTCAFGLKKASFSGASALSVLVLSAGAARGWGSSVTKSVAAALAKVWNKLAQPLLFGLVGSSVSIGSLDAHLVGVGILMLACSVAARCGVAYLVVGGRGMRWQERLFIAMAWMPKATVQAALGGIALDEATDEDERSLGRKVLAISVLAILCTAPIGAIAISRFGPKLLLQETERGDTAAIGAARDDDPDVARAGDEAAALEAPQKSETTPHLFDGVVTSGAARLQTNDTCRRYCCFL